MTARESAVAIADNLRNAESVGSNAFGVKSSPLQPYCRLAHGRVVVDYSIHMQTNESAPGSLYHCRPVRANTTMHRRSGFTITEMLVSMALIMFIMVILSEAFIAGVDTFRQLKAIGDMETKFRSVAAILRRDLEAPHFCNDSPSPMRLNNFNPVGAGNANLGGFFAIMATPNWGPQVGLVSPPPTSTPGYSLPVGSTDVYVNASDLQASSPQPGTQLILGGQATGSNETITVSATYVPGSTHIILSSPTKVDKHTKIQWPIPSMPEGYDADRLPSWGVGATGYALHFTVNLSGVPHATGTTRPQRRENYFTANLSNALSATGSLASQGIAGAKALGQSTIPTASSVQNLGQPPFYDPANYYTPFAEVAYFLRHTGQFTPQATQGAAPGNQPTELFNLYRRQLAVLATPNDYSNMNGSPVGPLKTGFTYYNPQAPSVTDLSTVNTWYYDFSWIPMVIPNSSPTQYNMHFNSMQDLVKAANRSLTYGIFNQTGSTNPSGWWTAVASVSGSPSGEDPSHLPRVYDRGEPQNLKGADLLLTNVVDMTISARYAPDVFTNPPGAMSQDFRPLGSYDTGITPFTLKPFPFRILAIQIGLRVWDQTTQKTRQLTIVQNM